MDSSSKKLYQMSQGAKQKGLASYAEGVVLAGVLLALLFISNLRNPLGELVKAFVCPVGRLFGVNYNVILLAGAILSLILFKRTGDDLLEKSENLLK